MRNRVGKYGFKLMSAVVIAAPDGLPIPGSADDRGARQQSNRPAPVSNAGETASGERKLTVVEGASGPSSQEVVVNQTHRIASSNIETWLSENEVKVLTTKLIKEATETEEPQYAYSSEAVNVSTGERRELTNHEESHPGEHLVKEEISPDGKYSFIQKWRDKYTADNFLKDLSTGKSIPVKGDNYMEIGGWLDTDTYVLAKAP